MSNFLAVGGPFNQDQHFNFDDIVAFGQSVRFQEVYTPVVDNDWIRVQLILPTVIGGSVDVQLSVTMLFDSGNGDSGNLEGPVCDSVVSPGVNLPCDGSTQTVAFDVGGTSPVGWLNDSGQFKTQQNGIYAVYVSMEFGLV